MRLGRFHLVFNSIAFSVSSICARGISFSISHVFFPISLSGIVSMLASSLSLSLLPFLGRLGLQLGPGSPRRGQPDGLMIAKTCLTLAPTAVAVAAANAI